MAAHLPAVSDAPEAVSASLACTAWLVVALLVPVALLNYLDRQMLAAMNRSMMSDIPDIATKANRGLVLGSFKWVYALLSNPPRPAGARRSPSPLAAVGELFSNVGFILLVLYFTLPAIAGWVVKDWMPAILNEKFNLGQGKAGVSAVLYVQLASLAGAGIGGWLADRWMRRSVRGRIYASALGMSFFLPALLSVLIVLCIRPREPVAQCGGIDGAAGGGV
jgi:hypothetical protein